MDTDGHIKSQGTLSSALEKDAKLLAYAAKERSQLKKVGERVGEAKPEALEQKATGNLTVAEEIGEGHVGWSACKSLFAGYTAFGGSLKDKIVKLLLLNTAEGPGVWIFWAVVLCAFLASRSAAILNSWVLGLWARQYEIRDPSQVSVF